MSAPSRGNYRPQVSAPRPSYRPSVAPRQTVSTPSRPINPSYRSSVATPSSGNSTRVTGYSPRGPRLNTSTTSRTYTPGVTSNQTRYSVPTATTTTAVASPNRYATGPNGNLVRVAPTNPGFATDRQVSGYRPGGERVYQPAQPVYQPAPPVYQPGQPVVVTGPVYNNNHYNNGYSYARNHCTPSYYNGYYNDPYFYSNYNYRRGYRYYQPYAIPFLSLGFFAARPYSYYDYASIDYQRPFAYGEDADYRAAPMADTAVASTQTTPPPSMEQDLLTELNRYVESNSKDKRFRVADPAFGNQAWSLDLTQAPAVYSIDSNHYSVISGFEGTLGDNTIPSSVGIEFFVARDDGRWNVKDAWIVSANGIPRAKRFKSPTYSQVQTWQEGQKCPFTGQPMVPLTEAGAQQG